MLVNQLTYRGYFYDFETGLYYLQSRYYSPTWHRFINADKHFDTQDGILGTNMYIYCQDNPVRWTDPSGEAVNGTNYTSYNVNLSVITTREANYYPVHTVYSVSGQDPYTGLPFFGSRPIENSDRVGKIPSETSLSLLGGYGKYYAISYDCSTYFINKNNVKIKSTISNGVYFVKNAASGKYMDVKDWGSSNGTLVQQWAYGGGTNQQWKFTYDKNGYYRISPQNATSKALDAGQPDAARSNDTNIQIWSYDSNYLGEQWIVAGDRIFTKASISGGYNTPRYIQIDAGSTKNGKIVRTQSYSDNDKQRWSYEEVTVSVTGVSLNKKYVAKHNSDAAFTLTATISPSNATNKKATWTSSDTSVATVNSSGQVTPKARGTTTITVKTNDGNKTATCHLTLGWYAEDLSGYKKMTNAKIKHNASFVYDYLRNKGWSKNAICGILGNMEHESGINPAKWNGDEADAYGIVQWNPSSKYLNWRNKDGRDYGETSLRGQLAKILDEVKDTSSNRQWWATTSYNYSFTDFTTKTDSDKGKTLAKAFFYNYERAGDNTASTRANYAAAWYDYLNW